MSAHLRVSLSSLLLELASCVAWATVPCRDVGKDGDGLPMSRENSAVSDVFAAEDNVDVALSSTSIRANDGFEYDALTFRKTMSHAFARDSGGGSSILLAVPCLNLCLIFTLLQFFLFRLAYWPPGKFFQLVLSVSTVC